MLVQGSRFKVQSSRFDHLDKLRAIKLTNRIHRCHDAKAA